MTAHANTLAPAPTPMEALATRLRPELCPTTQLEEMFFDQIVRLSVLASFLMNHVEADPEFLNPETTRRMRMLLSNESRLRCAYEEFRRLQLARQLQREDPAQAARPLLAVVASHTSRAGVRSQPRAQTPPHDIDRQIQKFELSASALEASVAAACEKRAELFPQPAARPAAPGRNAQCPCGSGLKYKRCCANKPIQQAA
jgi:SEC-C motif-containing protein